MHEVQSPTQASAGRHNFELMTAKIWMNLSFVFVFCLPTNHHHHHWDQTGHRFMTGFIPIAIDHFYLAFGEFYGKLSGPRA